MTIRKQKTNDRLCFNKINRDGHLLYYRLRNLYHDILILHILSPYQESNGAHDRLQLTQDEKT